MTATADSLPKIRSDLRLVGRRRDVSGADVAIIYDSLRHRFFEIGPLATAMLQRWRVGSRQAMVEQINATTHHQASLEDLKNMVQFLHINQLLSMPPPVEGHISLLARTERVIGHLFFLRVPLIHPDRILGIVAKIITPLLGRGSLTLFAGAALMALFLVTRQWDLFMASFRPVFTVGGAVSIVVAVALSKALHELGHALAAKRMKCAVPTMGVAFMFGAPLLYTDLSDTWRLNRRRDRLWVASAGILAEMMLATVATWGWLVMPNGPARGACFFLATAAWLATLVVNLNPFMRFDGYFMLSDMLGVPNLQERGFAHGRWVLRRLLWGTPEPRADEISSSLAVWLTAYAWSTWIFRLTVYFGLAFAAFHLLPKLVAIPLLIAELWVLVFRPITHELANWWRERAMLLGNPHGRITGLLVLGFAVWLVVPQSFQLSLPAVLVPLERQWIHPPRPARLVSHVQDGTFVTAGEVVAIFQDQEIEHRITLSRLRLAMLHMSEEQAARGQRSARELTVLRERIASETATLSGILAQQESLTVRAPFPGRVIDSDTELKDGRWYSQKDGLFLLASGASMSITAFVDDRDLEWVVPRSRATFHPDAVDYPVLSATVSRVEMVPSEYITEPLLASITGGPMATERNAEGRAVPNQGQYRVTAWPEVQVKSEGMAVIVGHLMVQTKPYSLLGLMLQRLQAVLIKEASP